MASRWSRTEVRGFCVGGESHRWYSRQMAGDVANLPDDSRYCVGRLLPAHFVVLLDNWSEQ